MGVDCRGLYHRFILEYLLLHGEVCIRQRCVRIYIYDRCVFFMYVGRGDTATRETEEKVFPAPHLQSPASPSEALCSRGTGADHSVAGCKEKDGKEPQSEHSAEKGLP